MTRKQNDQNDPPNYVITSADDLIDVDVPDPSYLTLAGAENAHSQLAYLKSSMGRSPYSLSKPKPPIKLRVGNFILYKDGSIGYGVSYISLEPKQQKVLTLLIENANSVVGFDNLRDVYWDDDLEEDSKYLDTHEKPQLHQALRDCVSKIKKILVAHDQDIKIQNHPRIGYKLIV